MTPVPVAPSYTRRCCDLQYRLVLFFLAASPMWPTYAGVKIGSLPIVNLHRIMGLVFAATFVCNLLLSRAWFDQMVRRLRPVSAPIFLVFCFFQWRFLSTFASRDVGYSFFLVAIDFLLQFVVFVAVVVSFDDLAQVKSAMRAILCGAVLVVFFGVIEFFNEKNLFVNLAPSSLKNVDFIASAITEKIRETYRVQVAFMHPLVLAEYLITILPISALFLFDRGLLTKMAASFVFGAGILVLYATGSRSGALVLALQVFAYCAFLIFPRGWNFRSAKTALFGSCLIAATTVLTLLYGKDLVIGRGGAETMSTVARLIQLMNGVEAVLRKPLFGYGQGFAADYIGVENIATGQLTLDNYYLTVVVESGIPAMLLFSFAVLTFFRYSRKNKLMDAAFHKSAADLISCSVIGFSVFCFILSTYEVFSIAFILFGLILVLHRISTRNDGLADSADLR